MGLFPSANDFKAGKGVEKDAPPDKLEGFLFMPVVGVEPTRVISTRDFESPSSAIPTHRRIIL